MDQTLTIQNRRVGGEDIELIELSFDEAREKIKAKRIQGCEDNYFAAAFFMNRW